MQYFMFSCEILHQKLESPCRALTLTEHSSRSVWIPSRWLVRKIVFQRLGPTKRFWCSYLKWFSSSIVVVAWPVQREDTQGHRGFWGRGSGAPGGSQSLAAGYSKPRPQNAPLSLCVRLTRLAPGLFFILKNDAVNIRSDGSCKFFERCFWNVLWLDR